MGMALHCLDERSIYAIRLSRLLRVKGGCEAIHATFSTSCDLSSYSVTAYTIDWFIVVTFTHILYVHVQS